ncbi:5-methyltetrahydropteroyltriglutamate--homocysteine methyltransferase [Chryseolinea serpens]|uniref:5-methyltetrahydropteroyltriglutamate--homocysteine methyltransferase n=1 Tax=Chryseolinea serpens TaxID=947013 RepID=A0A1M5M0A3_9BACT|nr:cobalamin-independent methionine synthase II family protein [Chryseolinea serpens]SHG70762.1 5-methyltetrahydropteroyltriglutamate--homocysteine methyltransferase [Chryseolinea serpens]
MKIPTEPIGSVPRPAYLVQALGAFSKGEIKADELTRLTEKALAETIHLFEQTGSPVISDGEQSKPSFATYPIAGMKQLAPDGVVIPFADGHTRQLPKLTGGAFRYQTYANSYLDKARKLTKLPVKQAVISASAISLLYPQDGIAGYSRDQFIQDLIREAEADIRKCLDNGAYNVQIDFTEARLAIKLDPSKGLLKMFIDLNNQVLDRFTDAERKRIGVHTCPGGDHDSTHSADVPYEELLPYLFDLHATNFYLEYAGEKNKRAVLEAIKKSLKPGQRVFLGVTNVLDPRVETPEEVCDLIVEAAKVIPADQLGTCDDCGFSPFADDVSTARETAFAKIKARIQGTALAEKKLGK